MIVTEFELMQWFRTMIDDDEAHLYLIQCATDQTTRFAGAAYDAEGLGHPSDLARETVGGQRALQPFILQ